MGEHTLGLQQHDAPGGGVHLLGQVSIDPSRDDLAAEPRAELMLQHAHLVRGRGRVRVLGRASRPGFACGVRVRVRVRAFGFGFGFGPLAHV